MKSKYSWLEHTTCLQDHTIRRVRWRNFWATIAGGCTSIANIVLKSKLLIWVNGGSAIGGRNFASWSESPSSPIFCFMWIVKVYMYQKRMTLKISGTVFFPVHSVLLSFSKEFRRYLIDHCYTLVGFVLVFDFNLSYYHEQTGFKKGFSFQIMSLSRIRNQQNILKTVQMSRYTFNTKLCFIYCNCWVFLASRNCNPCLWRFVAPSTFHQLVLLR